MSSVSLLGLDRVPEAKTLRRPLAELGGRQQAAPLAAALTAPWARGKPDELGILYVDGHVNVYTGRQHPLPKTLVPKRRQCLPAATDVGVHNGATEPLFFVTSPINAHLLTLLEEAVIPDARRQTDPGRPLTLVFDREAWSPKSFRQWHRQGIDVITYRQGQQTPWDPEDFRPLSVTRDGQPVTYWLAERSVQVIPATGKHRAFWMREIRRLCHHGHQTAILTTHQDLPAEEIADRLFGRWRQENFFKYMPREFDIDHLITYATEPADPERVVPNPERRPLEKSLKANPAPLGRAHVRQAKPNATVGYQKDPHQEMIERLGQECDQRRERLHAMAKRVPLKRIHEVDQIVHHERERKTITPLIKIVAYRRESSLARLVEPGFTRHDDEIRAFLKAVFRLPGDIIPDDDRGQRRVRLYGMANNRSQHALLTLCEILNAQQIHYPGTDLRLVYEAIQSH